MKQVTTQDLKAGVVLVMTKAPQDAPGLAHRICKVLAVDLPYMVVETGRGPMKTQHMLIATEAEFAEPSKELLIAAMPELILDAEVIDDTSTVEGR